MHSKKEKLRIKNSQVDIDFTNKTLTSFGGSSSLISHYLNTINFKEFIENKFPVQESSNNSTGSYSKLVTLLITILNGGTKFSHINYFGIDYKIIEKAFTIDRIAKSSSSMTRFWDKFNKQSLNEELLNMASKFASSLVSATNIASDSLRFDSTVITRYGCQEGAKRGYNPRKRGRPSHQPQIAFLGSGFTVNFWNRSGNITSGNGVIDFFDQTVLNINQIKITRILADSGYYNSVFIEHLEVNSYEYVISVPIIQVLQKKIYSISNWKTVAEGIEVSEFNFQHAAVNWGKERRYIVIRQNTNSRKKATGKQLKLFENLFDNNTYRHAVYITNNTEDDPYDIWNYYKPRANDENTIDNLKSGFGLDSFNLDNFWGTEAVLITIALIFHNLLHFLMIKVINPKHFRERLKTVRLKYFIIPGKLGKDGRRYTLQLNIQNKKKKNKFIGFFRLIDKLIFNCNAVQL